MGPALQDGITSVVSADRSFSCLFWLDLSRFERSLCAIAAKASDSGEDGRTVWAAVS
jgi:hypothetical protein